MSHPMLSLALVAVILLAAPAATAQDSSRWLDASRIELIRKDTGLVARFPVTNPTRTDARRRVAVTIAGFDGIVQQTSTDNLLITPGQNLYEVPLLADILPEKAPLYVLRYELTGQNHVENGGRNLVDAIPSLATRLLAYDALVTGSVGSLRLAVSNHATGDPIAGADITVHLSRDGSKQLLFQGATDPQGTVDPRFTVPEAPLDLCELTVSVRAPGFEEDVIAVPVRVQRSTKILLTCDKPLYQPGQTIEMRALSLHAATLAPVAGEEIVFEASDGKGNKVFKHPIKTDDFGVASASFVLATEVNLGSYTLRAILGESQTEKTVTVERYVLPKFDVTVATGKPWYRPGETISGTVQSDYFFGKPVAGGRVRLTASTFFAGFEDFATVDGRLDDTGHWTFDIPLPDFFAGSPIEQGQASVRLLAEVTDTADHSEEQVHMAPIAGEDLMIHVVPEGGMLAQGLENRVFVLVAYPDGSPAKGATVSAGSSALAGGTAEIVADDLGIAVLAVTPDSGGVALSLVVRDSQGRTSTKAESLQTGPTGDSLILRTEKTLYRAGETLAGTVLATKPSGAVYIDLVRGGQTVATAATELTAGRADFSMDLDPGMTGSVAMHAYVFTPGTDLVRDTRLLYVNPADALRIDVAPGKPVHLPGEPATVLFTVTNAEGAPEAAALGIAIVDESVFALQEIHPGLEKIYFTLEREIMTPRYEIHGYELDILVNQPMPREPGVPVMWDDAQQRAAEVLLAGAETPPAPPVQRNSSETRGQAAREAMVTAYTESYTRVLTVVMRYLEEHQGKVPSEFLRVLLRQKLLRESDLLDPWGNRYVLDFAQFEQNGMFTMTSPGPDGIPGTGDDLSMENLGLHPWDMGGRGMGMMDDMGGVIVGGMLKRGDAVGAMQMQMMPMAAEAMAAPRAFLFDGPAGSAGPEPPRIREYFPETLLFEPSLITDGQGRATLSFDMADSITTWRMTAMASSRAGALGSTESPLRVFQDFFVDIDLPVALTQNDSVSIPVVAYNYLEVAQEVRLRMEPGDWFESGGPLEQTLALAAGEVRATYFPITVKGLGNRQLTVFAEGTTMSDAIRRSIEVLPDGEQQLVSFSDRLSAVAEHTVTIPGNAVEGASKILVRVYPGVFSQIIDGLDSMLQMPFGCFEQTTAVTYPNILVMQYLKATNQANPEVLMTAEGFINAGYQRLVSYEVDGGGFSWFGDAPANKALSALGLRQFVDMAEVHEVDPMVIDRTRAWLYNMQEADGSWSPDENYLHAESWQGIQGSNVLVTAYILDAVLAGGDKPASAAKAQAWLKDNWRKAADDAYTLALVGNAAAAWDRGDPMTAEVIAALHALRVEEGDSVHWKGPEGTLTFARGDSADIETTALATLALIRSGRHGDTASGALNWLVRKKGPEGNWGSTQATILSLKAMMEALGNQTEETRAQVAVVINGETAETLDITPETSDVMRLVDLGDRTKDGDNTVSLRFEGEGSMLYQVVGRYYTPWRVRPVGQEPMTITVAYDKTQMAVNDMVTVTAQVKNNRPAIAQMVVVDLGIPPGFEVTGADLEALVAAKTVSRYELTPRQIILYFEEVAASATIDLTYTMRAKFPLRAQTPQSRVYEYYNPEVENIAAPQALVVEE